MGVLTRLFGSQEALAQEIVDDDTAILAEWQRYLTTVPKKRELAAANNYPALQELLESELIDIVHEEETMQDLLADLTRIEHDKRIRRVQKLYDSLGFAQTKFEYVHKLLDHLHTTLKRELRIVRLIVQGKEVDPSHLSDQLELEKELLVKMKNIETFHDLFLALVKGEHIIRTMDATEKKLFRRMQGMQKIFSGELERGVTYAWVADVYDAFQDEVEEAIADGRLDNHPHVDFEFINSSAFVTLVRNVLLELKPRGVSERMITIFVHYFREWFNDRD